DAHYDESATHPMKFRYAMHNFTGGRPGLAKVFERFLEYVKTHQQVWFCRCIDMAEFWAEQERLCAPGK
ncbi:MAG TPA: allantoinase, partial [Candidatus Binatia bacterium]|nr:allantoinase [Candidatus Binatia bacterium]